MGIAYCAAVIERGADGYGVFFPDLPGCTSAGDTPQHAARNAEEALQAHIELSAEHGDTSPSPSELDALPFDPDVAEVARLLVWAEVPGKLLDRP